MLAYFFSYLDRVNLGFAALTMNAELKFSPTIFAWGAGIFFIGYFIFEVSSNLALEKIRRQPLDRAHHGDLRHHLRIDGAGQRRLEFLRLALSARRRRGWIFPWPRLARSSCTAFPLHGSSRTSEPTGPASGLPDDRLPERDPDPYAVSYHRVHWGGGLPL